MYSPEFASFFRDAPPVVDLDAIWTHWQALEPSYDVAKWQLPLPPWRRNPYTHVGQEAWAVLQHDLAQSDSQNAFCIYLHIPFCFAKCGFCDSYSFKLGSHQSERIQEYVDILCDELCLWSKQGNLSQRPVSTVHLGGGTPTFIGEQALTRIVDCCRKHFSVNDSTEWALESTVQELTPSMMDTMHALGYQRLHIGVQSLEETVRGVIGRKTEAHMVLEKIESALALGWIVSIDAICGLPHQTLRGFIEGIEKLLALGVNGFSLYELLIYPQNQRWAHQYHLVNSERHLPNYWLLMAGANVLEQRGYRKNLFNHWADERDQNIYFTFPSRGEDLLAVGTIADGVFGNYRYRHPRYAPYMSTFHADFPGLEGGLRCDEINDGLQLLTNAILSAYLSPQIVDELPENLRRQWLNCRLVEWDSQGGLNLTMNGSWFAGNMIAELT